MYINRKHPILSKTIFMAAVINLAEIGFSGGIRLLLRGFASWEPDMMNEVLALGRNAASVFQALGTAAVFYAAWRHLLRDRSVLPRDDYAEMAKLQEEMLGPQNAALSSYSIGQLLQVWAAILVGVEIVYDITSGIYKDFIAEVSNLINMEDERMANAFVSAYNSSHGFKYIGMFIAITLGVFVTGVFLRDKFLQMGACVIMAFFLLAFELLQMDTFIVFSRMIGIVWTSVLFHLLQTAGLMLLALYLGRKYKGL